MGRKKAVLISGGTSGIGLATAAILASRGWSVAINGRNISKGKIAEESLQRLPGKVRYLCGDVSDVDDCHRLIDETVRLFGTLDGVVTAAGYYQEKLLHDLTEAEYAYMMAVNVKGTIFLCKYALPLLRQTKGNIVTVASDAGIQGNVACSLYGATKGAVVSFTKSLALETAPYGIRVNCVCPGDVDTPLLEAQLQDDEYATRALMGNHYPLGRIAKPEEVGHVIAFLLSEEASFVTAAA